MRTGALCVAVALLTACGRTSGATTTVSTLLETNATVVRVVDGDTIVARVRGADETIRLIGIDTPETVKPNAPVECFGPEASAFTGRVLPVGTPLHLVRDAEARDDYDRLLAYVYRASDAMFVNLEIVRSGHAVVLTIPPNVAHTGELVAAARQARESGQGLWSTCG